MTDRFAPVRGRSRQSPVRRLARRGSPGKEQPAVLATAKQKLISFGFGANAGGQSSIGASCAVRPTCWRATRSLGLPGQLPSLSAGSTSRNVRQVPQESRSSAQDSRTCPPRAGALRQRSLQEQAAEDILSSTSPAEPVYVPFPLHHGSSRRSLGSFRPGGTFSDWPWKDDAFERCRLLRTALKDHNHAHEWRQENMPAQDPDPSNWRHGQVCVTPSLISDVPS